jgi:hypothetical protein
MIGQLSMGLLVSFSIIVAYLVPGYMLRAKR